MTNRTTHRKTSRTIRLASISAAAACITALLGGCNTVSQADYDNAIAENEELRDRLASAQDLLEQSEEDKADLYEENRDLSADLSRAQQAAATAPAGNSDAGFSSASGPAGGGTYGTRDVILSVAGDILFDTAQVTIKQTGQRELDRIARLIMTQYPANTIRVEGYTDPDPIRRSHWKTNERLSSERALAVEAYLVSRGIDTDRIYSAAMGPAKPKSSKAESRRVEIVILAN